MARRPQNPSSATSPERRNNAKTEKHGNGNGNRMKSRDAAERSAYFARREAAKVLRQVLRGDASRRAAGSIKTLVYSPAVRNKKATLALVCQTLKCLAIIKEILETTGILSSKWKKQEELVYVTIYDVLFGQEIAKSGLIEKFINRHKEALELALAKACAKRNVKNIDDLFPNKQNHDISKPRYIRVNTLKIDTESAINELGKICTVKKDEIIPDLLELPAGTDLHNHSLVLDGSLFLQGKASCMVASALSPKPNWKVIDACAAPGNKTAHLAAIMKNKGNIIACELNESRVKILQKTVKKSGAKNIEIKHGDFLDIDTKDPSYKKVNAILLDPSCSGSGISAQRLDHLLPSYSKDNDFDDKRIEKLSAFQRMALEHALSFPSVERVVYSTCSIHQEENEDVIKTVLPLANSLGFELESPFPQWERRGIPVFDGSEHLVRTDPTDGMEGFFIALFVRKNTKNGEDEKIHHHNHHNKNFKTVYFASWSKMLLYNNAAYVRKDVCKGGCCC
ncbi:hypothetical protein LUZ60_012361 [Juncus effusus]|nr:hypothetical protein LUZ60_012361 [Juncus effusus]